ncbi:aminopeptidase P N-terminal domain-containing protein [Oleiharenicola lentus]|uniref:aminopeptidase P N-terminal domain-containing protein n=1 Tax=Oleiharenicola lentus TaxID=2508720 RepID=UPI003F66AC56
MQIDHAARRARIAPALGLHADEILLVGAGHPVPRPELSEQHFPFIAHQEYLYLTGHEEAPGGVIAYDAKDNTWTSFVPEVTELEKIWDGTEQLPGEFLGALPAWLDARRARRVIALGAPLAGVQPDVIRTTQVRETYKHARRPKEPGELAIMRRCATATTAGYKALQPFLKPGVSERRMQIELEAEYFRHGAQTTGYSSIVGVGAQSAVFHGSPSTERIAKDGDFILIDSGAQWDRYVIDVTRTYVAGTPTAFQKDFAQAVIDAQQRACARCLPGAEWVDIHLATAVDMVNSLISIGLMKGNATALVEQEAHTLFFPHGLGHMVGLGVRDAGGVEPGRIKNPRPSLKSLRMDLILRPGYIVTVEPGLYFIPALINNVSLREKYRDAVNWPLAEKCLGLGGVRFEDNLVITDGEPENLTAAIPKTLTPARE